MGTFEVSYFKKTKLKTTLHCDLSISRSAQLLVLIWKVCQPLGSAALLEELPTGGGSLSFITWPHFVCFAFPVHLGRSCVILLPALAPSTLWWTAPPQTVSPNKSSSLLRHFVIASRKGTDSWMSDSENLSYSA